MDPLDEIAALRETVDTDPTDVDAHVQLAAALRDLADYAALIPYAERAFELRADSADAAKLAALGYHMTGNAEAAWSWYGRALALAPDDPVLAYNAGIAADALLQHEDAIRLYRRALELRPMYPEALNNLGIALANHGRFADAALVFRTLLELRDDVPRPMAHCNLGLAYLYLGRYDAAIESLEAAIALDPNFAVAYCNLGNAHYAQGDTEQAAAMYRRAIELDPDNVTAYNALGAIGGGAETVPAAVVGEYEEYLDRYPWSALVYYNLGLALADRGKDGEAIAQFDKALLMEPRFREAERAKAALLRARENPDGD